MIALYVLYVCKQHTMPISRASSIILARARSRVSAVEHEAIKCEKHLFFTGIGSDPSDGARLRLGGESCGLKIQKKRVKIIVVF